MTAAGFRTVQKLEYFPAATTVGQVIEGRFEWVKMWKVMAYTTSGVNFPVESNERFTSEAEAQAAADRVNEGDESGLSFASYSDD